MNKYPPRPTKTPEIILDAAKNIAELMGAPENEVIDWAKNIAQAYNNAYSTNGYYLAKELDFMGWDIDIDDVDNLDSMESEISHEVNKLEQAWVKENNIKPALEIGTRIKEGVITGICGYSAARYLVKEDGQEDTANHTSRLLIKFEKAIPV